MKLTIEVSAWRDLEDIGCWIGLRSPASARRVLSKLLEAIAQIGRFPYLARKGRVQSTFERVVAGLPYIIVYQRCDRPPTVIVIAVVHVARHR